MDAVISPEFLNHWLGLVIDTALVFGFFFLWLSWHRNGKRQQKLEQLLAETARQLEEATQHLSQATKSIEQLKRQEQSKPRAPQPTRTKQPVQAPAIASQNSTQASMILRMKREGESPQTIAERLDMPLAQVKLLLKLHAASSAVE